MKNFRTTLILSAILVVLLAAYFLTNNIWAFEDRTIYKLDPQSIVEIDIESGQDKCTFIKNGDSWEMVYPKKYRINEELVALMARKLGNFEALRVLGKSSGDLVQYGLERPSMRISFKLDEGRELKLLIGNNTASNYQHYVMDSASKIVCTISTNDLEAFKEGKPSGFRDRSFLAQGLGRVKRLVIKSETNEDMNLEEYEKGKWKLVEPCEADVKNDVVSEIITAIAKLEIKDFVEDDAEDLAKYGLADPVYTVFLEDEGGNSRNFFFGLTDNDGKEIYMTTDNQNGVYKTLTEAFDPGSILLKDLISVAPLSIGIDNISRITVVDGDSESVFQRDLSSEDDFTLNGHSISNEDFMALYVNIMALSAEGYDGVNRAASRNMSITFELIGSTESIMLELYERNDSSYFMAIDGKLLPLYITDQKVELVRRWMKRVSDSVQKGAK